MYSLRGYVPILCALLMLGFPSTSSAQWLVYDNFDGGLIDPAKWSGFVTTRGPASPSADVNRAISDGKLVLAMTQWGRADSDADVIVGANGLSVTNPSDILGMEAEVSIKKGAVAEGCPANPAAVAQARARMLASFFNDGTSTGPGDSTGDIVAVIETVLDAVQGKVLLAVMFRCSNSSCSVGDSVIITNFTTTWAFNQPHVVRFVWDPANDKFIYTVISKGAEEILEIPYLYNDALPPRFKFRQLQVRPTAPNCNGSRKSASLESKTDYVSILPAP